MKLRFMFRSVQKVKMTAERGSNAILIVRQRDFVGHILELIAGVAHGHAMTGKIEHAHVILGIAKSHDLATLDAKTLADTRDADLLTPLTVAS